MKLYEIIVKDNKNQDVSLSSFKGKVLLIVNTATRCGFTSQYKELEELYEKFKDSGFEILDFPCNQFANQAPESDEEIESFCKINFDTKFARFKKIDVNGKNQSPLYSFLKSQKSGLFGKDIRWNFTKFLIDKNGDVIARFAPITKPNKIKSKIKRLI